MPLKITPPSEPLVTTSLILTIFGDPGAGKSTLAYSGPKPLLLDFDGGAHRATGRKNTVRMSSWRDVADITAADLAPYDCIALDTVGRALEFLADQLVVENPKFKRSTGELTQQGYGALKGAFRDWMRPIRNSGKHIIFIAHAKEEKDGENFVQRVDAMGATRTEVVRLSDLVGFVSIVNGKRTLEFSPTEKHTGKNCAGFDPLIIPDVKLEPLWLAGVMADALKRLNELTEEQRAREAMIAEWMQRVDVLATVDDVNGLIPDVPHDQAVRALVARKAKSLGFVWNGAAYAMPTQNGAAYVAA